MCWLSLGVGLLIGGLGMAVSLVVLALLTVEAAQHAFTDLWEEE